MEHAGSNPLCVIACGPKAPDIHNQGKAPDNLIHKAANVNKNKQKNIYTNQEKAKHSLVE